LVQKPGSSGFLLPATNPGIFTLVKTPRDYLAKSGSFFSLKIKKLTGLLYLPEKSVSFFLG
jgi:hypothetical protein